MLGSRLIKNRALDKWEHDLLLKVMERKVKGAKATITKDQGTRRPATYNSNVTWNLQGHKQPYKAHSAPNLSNATSTPQIIPQTPSIGALSPEVQQKIISVSLSGGNYRASRGPLRSQKENVGEILDLETLATVKFPNLILDDVVQELLNIKDVDILSAHNDLDCLSSQPFPNCDSPPPLAKDFSFHKTNVRPIKKNTSHASKKQNSHFNPHFNKKQLERLEKSWVVNWADKSIQEQVANKFKKKNVPTPRKPVVKCY